jgi:hypothetical protein
MKPRRHRRRDFLFGSIVPGPNRKGRLAAVLPTSKSGDDQAATAAAFVLGAVAAFVAVLLGRMTSAIERIRSLNEIADDDAARAHLKSDIPRLRQRGQTLE